MSEHLARGVEARALRVECGHHPFRVLVLHGVEVVLNRRKTPHFQSIRGFGVQAGKKKATQVKIIVGRKRKFISEAEAEGQEKTLRKCGRWNERSRKAGCSKAQEMDQVKLIVMNEVAGFPLLAGKIRPLYAKIL